MGGRSFALPAGKGDGGMKHQGGIRLLVLCSLLLTLSGGVGAQGPPENGNAQVALGTAFTYQGRLLDGGGLANGNYDFRFILYDAEVGGSQVGGIVYLSVVVVDGLFAVQLDFGSAAFDGGARYLEIAVRPEGSDSPHTPLMPRQALTATPSPWNTSTMNCWMTSTGVFTVCAMPPPTHRPRGSTGGRGTRTSPRSSRLVGHVSVCATCRAAICSANPEGSRLCESTLTLFHVGFDVCLMHPDPGQKSNAMAAGSMATARSVSAV